MGGGVSVVSASAHVDYGGGASREPMCGGIGRVSSARESGSARLQGKRQLKDQSEGEFWGAGFGWVKCAWVKRAVGRQIQVKKPHANLLLWSRSGERAAVFVSDAPLFVSVYVRWRQTRLSSGSGSNRRRWQRSRSPKKIGPGGGSMRDGVGCGGGKIRDDRRLSVLTN